MEDANHDFENGINGIPKDGDKTEAKDSCEMNAMVKTEDDGWENTSGNLTGDYDETECDDGEEGHAEIGETIKNSSEIPT
jgi:hypothetical protein